MLYYIIVEHDIFLMFYCCGEYEKTANIVYEFHSLTGCVRTTLATCHS